MRLINIDNLFSLFLTSYKVLSGLSQGCTCVVPFVFICQWLTSSNLLLLSALLFIRVNVFHIHFINLLLFLLLVFVSVVTGYHYKLHFYIQDILTTRVSRATLHSLGFASWCNHVAFTSLSGLCHGAHPMPWLSHGPDGRALRAEQPRTYSFLWQPHCKQNSRLQLPAFASDFCWWQSSYDLNMFGL